MSDICQRIHAQLARLYGEDRVQTVSERLFDMIDAAKVEQPAAMRLTERDAVLNTYGDMVSKAGEPPLVTLRHFLKSTVHPVINSVHILPFYPYSSDDGFSV